jgi:hypothetical protein
MSDRPPWIDRLVHAQRRYERAKADLVAGQFPLDQLTKELGDADAERAAASSAGRLWQEEMMAAVPEVGA